MYVPVPMLLLRSEMKYVELFTLPVEVSRLNVDFLLPVSGLIRAETRRMHRESGHARCGGQRFWSS